MENWLLYSLQSAVVLAVFYLFYKVLLSRETFHRFNRAVLLLSVTLAAVLPLCRITFYREVAMAVPDVAAAPLQLPVAATQEGAFDLGAWIGAAGWIYLCGVAAYLLYGLVSVGAVVRLLREGRSFRFGRHGVRLVLHGRKEAPFSWIRWIVLSEHDFRTAARPIVTHESAHLRSGHSWDLLAADLLGAVQWFNPAMWLVRAELRAIHEYEADAAVLRSGADARAYQLLLIEKAVGARWCSVANSFNHSKLKNRITMMLREKSSARTALRALYLVPLTGFALGAFARTVTVPASPADKVNENPALVQASAPEKMAADPHSAVADTVAVEQPRDSVSFTYLRDGKEVDTVVVKYPLVGNPMSFVYILDGKEIDTVEDLDPKQIKSFTILKNPEEVAKYGERARDGVVIITTKSSKTADAAAPKIDSTTIRVVKFPPAGDPKSFVYILDGKEIDTIEDLDPERIKSFTILKNPEEVAKYGERARDGVVILSTKSSKTADAAAPKIDSTTVTVVKFEDGTATIKVSKSVKITSTTGSSKSK